MAQKFWQGCRKRHIWLGSILVLLACFLLLKRNVPFMEWITRNCTAPLKRALGMVSSLFPFSVAELLIACCVVGVPVRLVLLLRRMCKEPDTRFTLLYRGILTLCCSVLTVLTLIAWLWSANYQTPDFSDQIGVPNSPVTLQQLTDTTTYFVEQLNRTVSAVPRGADGSFAGDETAIYAESKTILRGLEARYPFLKGRELTVKRVLCSRVMSYLGFTGFFFPITGEANLNCDAPLVLVPATIAHELSHQRGVAREQEANFAAVLACEASGIPAYEYSGWLLGYLHLNNALYAEDNEAWASIYDGLDDRVKRDLEVNNLYWQQYETPAADVGNALNDQFIKQNGDDLGSKSYEAVVNLLCAYYCP